MKRVVLSFIFIISLLSNAVYALSERHIILIRAAEAQHNVSNTFNSSPKLLGYRVSHLTQQGKLQAKNLAERLATHGFDNRNIAAVYVSSLPRALQTANVMATYGIFSNDKIRVDDRLNTANFGLLEGKVADSIKMDSWHLSEEAIAKYEVEANRRVRNRMLQLYDEIERNHPTGHILLIGHGLPEMELMQEIIQIEVRLNPGEAYILPLTARANVASSQPA